MELTMTMHLERGLTTLNTRKRKTKIDSSAYLAEFHEHNKQARRDNLPQLQFATLDQYVEYRTGSGRKVAKDFKPMQSKVLPTRFIRETPQHKSLGGISGSTAKASSRAYSGDYMIGIATLHKSNLVPVGREDDPINYSTMRRN